MPRILSQVLQRLLKRFQIAISRIQSSEFALIELLLAREPDKIR